MVRKTYHYDEKLGCMVEGPAPQRGGGSGDGWRFSDRAYSANPFKGHDGTIIHSRKSHREYMKAHGLTTVDDYRGEWNRAEAERKDWYEKGKDPTRKQDIIDAIHKLDPI